MTLFLIKKNYIIKRGLLVFCVFIFDWIFRNCVKNKILKKKRRLKNIAQHFSFLLQVNRRSKDAKKKIIFFQFILHTNQY